MSATIGPYFICFFSLRLIETTAWRRFLQDTCDRFVHEVIQVFVCTTENGYIHQILLHFSFLFILAQRVFCFSLSLSLFPFPFTLKCFFHFRDSLPLFSPVFLSPVSIAVGRTLAIDLLSQIPPSPVSTTIFTFGSCINACAMTGEWQVALKLLGQLKDARCWGFWWSLLSGGKSGSVPMFFCPSRNMQHVQPRLRYPYFRRHSYGRWLHS